MWQQMVDSSKRKTWIDTNSGTTISLVATRPVITYGDIDHWDYDILVRFEYPHKDEQIVAHGMDEAERKVKMAMMEYGKSRPPDYIKVPSPAAISTMKATKRRKKRMTAIPADAAMGTGAIMGVAAGAFGASANVLMRATDKMMGKKKRMKVKTKVIDDATKRAYKIAGGKRNIHL